MSIVYAYPRCPKCGRYPKRLYRRIKKSACVAKNGVLEMPRRELKALVCPNHDCQMWSGGKNAKQIADRWIQLCDAKGKRSKIQPLPKPIKKYSAKDLLADVRKQIIAENEAKRKENVDQAPELS